MLNPDALYFHNSGHRIHNFIFVINKINVPQLGGGGGKSPPSVVEWWLSNQVLGTPRLQAKELRFQPDADHFPGEGVRPQR